MDGFMLSPTSSTDAVSSASLMMIAQQFFQQQQIQIHRPQQNHLEAEEDDPVDDPVAAYLDGFSPPPTPGAVNFLQQQQQQQQNCGSNDWIECLMLGGEEEEEEEGEEIEPKFPKFDQEQHQQQQQQHRSEQVYASESSATDHCSIDECIWREHFGLNVHQMSSCCSSGGGQWPNHHRDHHENRKQQGKEEEEQQCEILQSGLSHSDHDLERQEQVIGLLMACADSIQAGSQSGAKENLGKLKSLGSLAGEGIQKCASYFGAGIQSILEEMDSSSRTEAQEQDEQEQEQAKGEEQIIAQAYKALNDACPYLKFAHLTANQALLEATQGAARIHIVDCGTMQGVQWAAFLQALASSSSSPSCSSSSSCSSARRSSLPRLRITGIPSPHLGSSPAAAMIATQRRLTDFARLLNLQNHFDFCPLLDPQQLQIHPDEVLALNFNLAFSLPDSMLLLRRLKPQIVTVAEYQSSPTLRDQVQFYCAVFDSLDAAMQRDDPQRIQAEQRFFAKEIKNGLRRLVLDHHPHRRSSSSSSSSWQDCVDGSRLWIAPLSHYTISQARLLLWLYNKSDNFTLLQQGPGSLSLAWLGRPIVTVSAWHCS